jgi:hypothetical protein
LSGNHLTLRSSGSNATTTTDKVAEKLILPFDLDIYELHCICYFPDTTQSKGEEPAITCDCLFTPDTTLSTQLPPGLTAVNGTNSITISGVPTKAVPLGTLGFFVRDKKGHLAEWTIQFQVIQSAPFMLHPGPAAAPVLPVAFAGQPYNVQLMMNDPAGAFCPISSTAAAFSWLALDCRLTSPQPRFPQPSSVETFPLEQFLTPSTSPA